MHCADPYTKNTHLRTAHSQGMRLQRGDSCSDIRTVQEGEKQFDVNHCREPNFQLFGVTQSPKRDNLNCAKTIAMEESLLPTTPDNKEQHQPSLFFLFSHWTHVTQKGIYIICDAITIPTHTGALLYKCVLQNVKKLKTNKQE